MLMFVHTAVADEMIKVLLMDNPYDPFPSEEAEKLYWEAAGIFGEIGEKDLRATVLQSISRLQLGGGRFMEAIASMESGINEVEKPSFTQRISRIPAHLGFS